jgi:uncharacterized protein YycO
MVILRFSRGSSLGSAIIRFATWSDFSHVGFKLENGLVLDATPEFGVTVRDARDDATTQYCRVTPPDPLSARVMQWAYSQIGRPYDWAAIVGFALRRDWHRNDKWFCAEFVAEAFHQVRYDLLRFDGLVDRITPRDLLLSDRLERVRP